MHTTRNISNYRKKIQKGVSLIELMVGITIGLLTITTALGALIISRSLTGTVNEVSQLQQQASYAFRIISQQIRQSGGRVLKPAQSPTEFGEFDNQNELPDKPISGNDNPAANEFSLSIAYQNSADRSYPLENGNPVERTLLSNCLGENPGTNTAPALISQFKVTNNELICSGNGNIQQSIISGVRDLRISYLIQSQSGTTQKLQRLSAADVTATNQWSNVYAIEVCLELTGNQHIETADMEYTRCDGTTAKRDNRLRMVFKNNFYINNHSWNTAS